MPDSEQFTIARRVHRSMLAAGEKKLLIWIAERLPRWINSDHLTTLGAPHMRLIPANLLSVGLAGLLNFVLAEVWVFGR